MDAYKKFDLAGNDLHGVNLIEASAGTGKTYTIAGIYIRLIIELGLTVENILVVTFTDAATLELKERIRARLKDAVKSFEVGDSDDPLMSALIRKAPDNGKALELLRDSLRNFDQAAVYTIHGFCQRMLVENAFESGSLFETELVGDSSDLVEMILKDFWRTHIYTAEPLFIQWLSERKFKPLSFLPFVRNGLKQGIIIKPIPRYSDMAVYENDLKELYNKCKECWKIEKETITDTFLSSTVFNGNKYRKSSIPLWLKILETFFTGELLRLTLPECFEKFTSDYMDKKGSMKKGMSRPDGTFYDLASTLYDAYETLEISYAQNLLWYKNNAVSYVKQQMELRKQQLGITGFDDLLVNLYKGLKGNNGKLLAENVKRKYSAALIDEFQDTDPVQYEIFFRIFGDAESSFFMIGDPKQAIYSFRGADIFAYMNASQDAGNAYTLMKNYRSEPEIIEAVNTIFKNADNPFLFEEISFSPVEAADLDANPVCRIDDADSFFNIWQLKSDKVMSKGDVFSLVPQVVASEITRLMGLAADGMAESGGRRLKEKDIAVLVRTNEEARGMKDELNSCGIPAVIYSTGNVFLSEESVDLHRVLTAIIQPGNEGALKAALVTDMIGCNVDDLADFEQNPGRFEKIREIWVGYHKEWLKSGFIRMFNGLIKKEKVLIRLMQFINGERRNTNILHLSQLLHKVSVEKKYGPEMLLKWFREQSDPAKVETEEHQLRLESDSESVRIVTIHKSKGMEYPVVFCPYVWSGPVRRNNPEFCVFHDENDAMALTLDAGSDDFSENNIRALKESLAEDLRILYVALTRAKSRCYIVWGRVKGAENTALAHLLYQGGKPDTDLDVTALLGELTGKSNGAIFVSDIPAIVSNSAMKKQPDDIRPIAFKAFTGYINTDYKIASFSSLTSNQHHDTDGIDRDEVRGDEHFETGRSYDIYSFPRGAAPGTFMHSLFEDLDFTSDLEQQDELVRTKLDLYGYSSDWHSCVLKMVKDVLSAPLYNDNTKLTLSCIAGRDRINELEFYFPLKTVRSNALNSLLREHGVGCDSDGAAAFGWNLEFSTVEGFMKGFIDMIFRSEISGVEKYYIVDWKSNWIGNSPADYHDMALAEVMMKEYYILQYLLYTVAFNRYLLLKKGDSYNYDKHFGGVFYVFLRGVAPELSGSPGIYFDKPRYDLIQDLSDLLLEAL